MIKCIFYSEFDNIVGPKIVHQVPENFMSNDLFDKISEYIITKPTLCGRTVGVRSGKYWIMGRPVCLSHAKYTRNALLFNLGVVIELDGGVPPATALQQLFRTNTARETRHTLLLDSLEEVLTKLGNYLSTLEIEKEFLSRGRENKTKLGYQSAQPPRARELTFDHLPHVMQQLIGDLNARAECAVSLTDSHLMHVKLLAKWLDPPEVLDYHVPVPVTDLSLAVTHEWDLSVQRIIPLVDGVHYVKKIALLADMDIELVKRAVQHLVYYDCCRLVHDVMQSSNRYTATAQLTRLMHTPALQRNCLRAVRLHHAPRTAAPPLAAVTRLYAALRPHQALLATLRELEGQPWLANFDLRGFINFGLVHGLIRRVHKYPLSIDINYWNRFRTESGELWDTSDNSVNSGEHVTPQDGPLRFNPSTVLPLVQQMTDGKHSFDEISCALGLPYSVIDQFFDKCIYR